MRESIFFSVSFKQPTNSYLFSLSFSPRSLMQSRQSKASRSCRILFLLVWRLSNSSLFQTFRSPFRDFNFSLIFIKALPCTEYDNHLFFTISRNPFSINQASIERNGLGPQSLSTAFTTIAQWSKTSLRYTYCLHIGHDSIHSSETRTRSNLLFADPLDLNHVKSFPTTGSSKRELESLFLSVVCLNTNCRLAVALNFSIA